MLFSSFHAAMMLLPLLLLHDMPLMIHDAIIDALQEGVHQSCRR